MKDGALLSHKLPQALLLTVFLSEGERTLLRWKERKESKEKDRGLQPNRIV